jgi:ABC-2 type transport system permease protein
VIVVFIGAVTILPAVLAYVVGVAFSLDLSVLRDTWRILLASVAYGAIVAVVCGLVMLAFSSLSRNSRIVAAMWVGLWIVTNTIAGVLIAVTNPALQREVARRHGQLAEAPQRSIEQPDTRWVAVSFSGNLDCLRLWMLGTEGAYQQLMDAMLKSVKPAMEAAENMRRNPMARMFGGRRRRREVVEVDLDSDGAPEQVATPEFLQGLKPPFPWTWSAGILAGLCGLSLCILSTRVKSLDRLR